MEIQEDKFGLIGSFNMESFSEAIGSPSVEPDLYSKVLVGHGLAGTAPLDGFWKRSPLGPIVEEAQVATKDGPELATGLDKNALVGGGPDGPFSPSSGLLLDALDEASVILGLIENTQTERVLECSTPWVVGGEVDDETRDSGTSYLGYGRVGFPSQC